MVEPVDAAAARATRDVIDDIEDAVDIARADVRHTRAKELGWVWHGDGWTKGRRCSVLVGEGGDVEELYVGVGGCMFAGSLRTPRLSVCGDACGMSATVFDDEDILVQDFLEMAVANGYDAATCVQGSVLLVATFRALCAWFDVAYPPSET